MVALVIRTLYNNQEWKARCKQPYSDNSCYYCPDNKLELNIDPPSLGCASCDGGCWERRLCNEHFWGCTPYGCRWGKRVQLGMKVFFVFREPPGDNGRRYTLWGKTIVSSIEADINHSGQHGMNGYHLMYFMPFCPTPRNKWRQHLTSNDIVGNVWGQGNYRYISNSVAVKLDGLI
jgi:hypothetical protein